jgi:thiamine pyridinylase
MLSRDKKNQQLRERFTMTKTPNRRRSGAMRFFGLLVALALLGGCATTLKVALYPYVPDRHQLFLDLEAAFEDKHKGVDVVLVEPSIWKDKYYKASAHDIAETLKADIYEIDTIRLSDFIDSGVIAPLPPMSFEDFEPMALEAVKRDGKLYAAPHWLCGKVLIYRADAEHIAHAKTWQEFVDGALKHREPVLFDMYGTTTVGEWYLSMLADKKGLHQAEAEVIAMNAPDREVMATLNQLVDVCPDPYCRDEGLHDMTGVYAREFVRKRAIAYIGYTETLYYALEELKTACGPASACLKEEEIRIRPLPRMTPAATGPTLGWVDGLAISSKIHGRKKELALEFIRDAVSNDTYKKALQPEWPYVPRYLIPAAHRIPYENAPLYPDIYEAFKGRATATETGINGKLRELTEKQIHCGLRRHDCQPEEPQPTLTSE